ncbi:MAG: hypothetical protein NXI28_23875, partial [bacterium]|nr:hypothetical protein [bacterium]
MTIEKVIAAFPVSAVQQAPIATKNNNDMKLRVRIILNLVHGMVCGSEKKLCKNQHEASHCSLNPTPYSTLA